MIQIVTPPVLGWIEKKLSDKEMEHLWKCIEVGGRDWKSHLAGNNTRSDQIPDIDDILYTETLRPLCEIYASQFKNMGSGIDLPKGWIPYHLDGMWVNYQKQHEFNPLHYHDGIYSFVVWMKIPTEFEDQHVYPSTKPCASCFEFTYSDILGNHSDYLYNLGSNYEGTMLFFPSKLKHQVYPFYNSDETRISVSGNIHLNFNEMEMT